ncbi:MAG: hypothetical protein NTW03_03795 [Verrucomicrobia bacterium]|nr:hypothetical protein [Verrucomicrobiota bacterium]
MNEIDEEVSRSAQINRRLAEMRERQGYPQNSKNDLLMAYFDIVSEHHEAAYLLIREKLFGSGFVLVRPMMETLLRAAWVNACATNQQQAQLAIDDSFHFPKMHELVKQIDDAYSTETFFQTLKDNTWKSACGYVHSGLLQVSRRFDKNGYVGSCYPEADILEVLRAATAILILTAILFFKSTGCQKEALEAEHIGLNANNN